MLRAHNNTGSNLQDYHLLPNALRVTARSPTVVRFSCERRRCDSGKRITPKDLPGPGRIGSRPAVSRNGTRRQEDTWPALSLSQAGINDVHELRIFNYFISSSPSSSSCPLAIYLRSSLEPPPPAPAPASPRSVAAAIDRWPVRITCTSFPYLARSHEVRGKCHRRVQSALLGVS